MQRQEELLRSLLSCHQLQGVKAPETDGRMIPFGEGLDPNQDIYKSAEEVQPCQF